MMSKGSAWHSNPSLEAPAPDYPSRRPLDRPSLATISLPINMKRILPAGFPALPSPKKAGPYCALTVNYSIERKGAEPGLGTKEQK